MKMNAKHKPLRRKNILRVPAIELTQGKGNKLYCFTVDGKIIEHFATVSRVRREELGDIAGYQRPEVRKHIAEIRRYLESGNPMLPNALVLAFDPTVRFVPDQSSGNASVGGRLGHLLIPNADSESNENKPGFVVDGQQRLAAIREAQIDTFPVIVSAFIAHSDAEQREQFILVNSTKPLPKSLIYELLPTTGATLSLALTKRRFPAKLLARLNQDKDSPFLESIQTTTYPTGFVKDNSILRMIENSLSDGLLFRLAPIPGEQPNEEPMLAALKAYWAAVKGVFGDAWLPPKKSRLLHGAGILSMGFLMDTIADLHPGAPMDSVEHYSVQVARIKRHCNWTHGYWDFGGGNQIRWNEIQNTGKHISYLTGFLIRAYRSALSA